MKHKKIISLIGLMLTSVLIFAQDVTPSTYFSYGQILMAINLVLLLFVVLLIIKLSNAIVKLNKGVVESKDSLTWWDKFIALKAEKTEEELDLKEDFDGITELDNPTPPWFNFIFYTTIIIGILYLINYHVIGYGKLQDAEYQQELTDAENAKNEYLKTAGNLIDENSVVALMDASSITEGKNIYIANCKVCHGEFGEGLVGPNLTDNYWIHGGSISSIFKTIKYGVAEKGMVPWQNTLNGAQMQQLTSFILTLKGTNPANPKEPQGQLEEVTVAVDTLSTALN